MKISIEIEADVKGEWTEEHREYLWTWLPARAYAAFGPSAEVLSFNEIKQQGEEG